MDSSTENDLERTEEGEDSDSYEKDVQLVLSALVRCFRWTDAKIVMYSDGEEAEVERKILRLTNSLQRLSKSIIDCVSLVKNPRLKLSPDKEAETDIAKMVELLRMTTKKSQEVSF